jgi:nitrogen fixation protein NifU and related proteins
MPEEVETARYLGGKAGTPGQGPFMAVVIKVQGDRIIEAHFTTYSCPSAVACGEWLCEWLAGKTVADAGEIRMEEIAAGVGGLPLGKEHTAVLAANALREALLDG